MRPIELLGLTIFVGLLISSNKIAASEPNEDLFQKQVAPALATKCAACHRPDNLKGNLDLSTREGMLHGGDSGEALVPGKADESPLYTRVISHDGQKPEMPEKGEPLSDKEALALREWIQQGRLGRKNSSSGKRPRPIARSGRCNH